MQAICRRPGIYIDELIDNLDVEPAALYRTLKELEGDGRVCENGRFAVKCLDGPLTSDQLDVLLEESVMKRGDTSKAARLGIVLHMLNRKTPYGGVTLGELARKCGVVEKTIRRYIETLENDMGVKVIRKEQASGPTLFLLDRVYLPTISPEKAIIIFLSLLQQKGSALAGHVNTIKDVLVTHLHKEKYSPAAIRVEELQERVYFVEEMLSDTALVGELFSKIIDALLNNHRIKIWYFTASRGEENERTVEPYGLICKRQNWYLVGYCLKSRDIRTFRVDRIKDIHPYVYEKFDYPREFSLQEHMGQAWGVIRDNEIYRVRVKFDRTVAHLPRTIVYHFSQVIEEELPDGSLVVSFEVSGLDELKTWIIQWGDKVEVLEPEILRRMLRETAERIASLY